MEGYKEKYGLWFPEDMPDVMVELKCWKHWREPEYQTGTLKDPWDCFWRAVYQLLPREDFIRHRWAEEHVKDWTTENFVITWGAASSGKSNDAGLLAVLDWITDPHETVTILASTSLNMLKLRSYESVIRYFKKLQRHAPFKVPGKLRKTDSAIILDDEDESIDVTDKASIRGVAVAEGTEEEARAKLQGAHLPYVRLILDELSQMRPAAMKVRTNLAIGARNFKLIGLCNVDSFTDLAARHSIPLTPGGFKDLDPEVDEEWRSAYGKVRRHDGLRSPAIVERHREKELSFLLTKSVLDERLEQVGGNWDDPDIWTMIRAWPPQQGKAQTLLSMAEVISHQAMRPVVWQGQPAIKLIGVDPAFSSDGNKGVMQPLEIGYDKDGKLRLYTPPPRFIKIDASSKTPVLEQVSTQVAKYAVEYLQPGVHIDVQSAALTSLGPFIGVDDSATQSIADDLMTRYKMEVRRFVSNKAASDLKLAVSDKQVAKERIYNQGTELWAAVAAFVRANQMRGMPAKAVDQLTSRPTEPDKRPLRLVSKKARARDGGSGENSPDDMDALAIAVGVARFFLRIIAGSETIPPRFTERPGVGKPYGTGELTQKARRYDLDSSAYEHANA